MTLIRIDPEEMSAAAATLRQIAAELAEIGTAVSGLARCCCLPVAAGAEVVGAAGGVDRSLGGAGVDLGVQANDLTARGAVAANSSLPTASAAAFAPVAPGGFTPMLPSPQDAATVANDPSLFSNFGASFSPETEAIFARALGTGGAPAPQGPGNPYLNVNGGSSLAPLFHTAPSFFAPSRDELMNQGGGYQYISPSEYHGMGLGGSDSTLAL